MSVSPDAQSFCQNKNRVAPAVDSLREEFRKYLESGGLLDVLTGVVKDLYNKVTKPTDPLNFVIYDLGAVNFDTRECAALKEELRELKAVVKNLEEENKALRLKIEESAEYILAEIVMDSYTNSLKIPLDENELKRAILNSVQELFGDYGLACINAGFSLKMYNPATRILILRVHRKHQFVLRSALPFVTSAGDLQRLLVIRTLHVSGTIRSSLKVLIKFDKEKLNKLIHLKKLSGSDLKALSELTTKCQSRLTKWKT